MAPRSITWVIGGTSGIGEATAKWLSDEGADVAVTGEDCDVRSLSHLEASRRNLEGGLDSLSGIVFCAGSNHLEWIGASADSGVGIRTVLDTNLLGFINVLEVVAAQPLRDERPLSVVAVSSDAARRPMRTSIAYCASKAGLDMAVKVAARELGPFGWRINAVSPGMTDETGMQEYVDEMVPLVRGWDAAKTMAYERSQEVIPGRVHKDEVAELISQTLFGPEHLNGAIIEINGGR